MPITMVVTAFSLKMIDYTTDDVMAKAGNVTVLVKDGDEHMAVGPLKRPKATFLLGYTKEQAAQRYERLLETTSKENCS